MDKKQLNLSDEKEGIMGSKHIQIFELSENALIQVSQRVAFLYCGSI